VDEVDFAGIAFRPKRQNQNGIDVFLFLQWLPRQDWTIMYFGATQEAFSPRSLHQKP